MKIFTKRILALSICSALVGASVQAATYEVTEINTIDTHTNTVFIDENSSGEAVLIGSGVKDFSVQYQYLSSTNYSNIIAHSERSAPNFLNFDEIKSGDNETEDDLLRAGTPDDNAFFWVLDFLRESEGSFTTQQVGDLTTFININGNSEEVIVFDTDFEGNKTTNTDELTRSTRDVVSGITESGWIFGNASAPALPEIFDQNTDDEEDDVTYWTREFETRAFYSVDKGQTILSLVPPESTYGGISVISSINEDRTALGYASTSISERAFNAINTASESCSSSEQLVIRPVIVCINSILTANRLTLNNLYSIQAIKWEIDLAGEIVSEELLGNLITPHVDDTRGVSSFAQAANDKGTVVGYADGWLNENITDPDDDQRRGRQYAVVFKDNRVVELHPERQDHSSSRANDINTNNIAVGYVSNGLRNSFYHIDTSDIDNMEITFPKGFFTGSESNAKSINDNNLIVGNGDIETHVGGSARRTHGFLYDIANETFTNLNDFLPCDSPYTIIDANSINNSNEILATAIIQVEVTDSDGNKVLDDNGNPTVDEIAQAVRMSPISGEIEQCEVVEEKIERQGASIGLLMPFVLLLVGFRRKFLSL